MGATIYDVLDELRAASTSEADKGSKLERLMASYLRVDPVYAEQFSQVWLWNDWPGRAGKHDTGIDLVAVDRVTGSLVAIQCKFFAPHSTISKPDIDSFLSASGKEGFAQRIIVSTTDKWNGHAEDAIKSQQVPVRRIGMSDLEASPVDWSQFSLDHPAVLVTAPRKQLRRHQRAAVDAVQAGLDAGDRGKLIMACGTGKTFTSLRLAEQLVGVGGSVLFLVPSISLLSQSLREWSVEAEVALRPLAVCSDRKSSARSQNANEDISAVDLALPATTDVALLRSRLTHAVGDSSAMTVVFATYQSIDVVAQAQAGAGLAPFDLVICDEAHRTTGTTLAGQDESAFVRVHGNDYLAARKRLYMTATPRIYEDAAKAKAGQADAVLASMDDQDVYGPELYRLGFGEAVGMDLLSDYKVLVLAVDETAIAKTFQSQLSQDGELNLDDAAKIVGCWNGLAKRGQVEHSFAADPAPMKRAVAFAGTIGASKTIESLFTNISSQYAEAHEPADPQHSGQDDDGGASPLTCEVQHVDGSFNALERNARLDWLKADAAPGHCRILTNARCLSEGVDVPALDAVMFLSPRRSVVDIVQSVGRVMRKAPGKQFGYIILPVGIPAGSSPEQALRDNTRYAAVWEVLQALRAHDERFDARVNRIDLNRDRDDTINVIGVGAGNADGPDGEGPDPADGPTQGTLGLSFTNLDDWREALYAKIVAKVGSRRYWKDWAGDVATIAARHTTRITALLQDDTTGVGIEFDRFLEGLRGNLNASITSADAIDMLAQHLITRPVFDALFAGYDFAANNPVAQAMERMLATLDEHSLEGENHTLEKFYDSVRLRVRGIDNAEGRQRIIVELYDTFFATAFKKTVDRLGIVYTPVEIVDFLLHSADWALRQEFGQGLTDDGVHVIDGFTGTGTFVVRLLQSGLITPHDLARKYASELHANEILLLAYYIAAVNIETTYQDLRTAHLEAADYEPFPGLVLADTFQMHEDGDEDDLGVFPENNTRLNAQRDLDIRVVVGNPPYSSGQDNANDNNANETYPGLDASIRDTYAARSTAVNKNSLYDSYIRAIRWATLRIKDRGVIAYVTNGGFLDSNTADGLRKTLTDEFSHIYVFNLRGNQRTAGEQSRREGGKVFDAGSRATVAITVLVKNPDHHGPATLHYRDIGDCLTRQDKLRIVADTRSIEHLDGTTITPNTHGDWLGQRNEDFPTFLPTGDKNAGSVTIFGTFSGGLKSNRDAWVYNYSRDTVEASMRRMVGTYEAERQALRRDPQHTVTDDLRQISWNCGLRADLNRGKPRVYDSTRLITVLYRPFTKQHVYFDRAMNDRVYQLPKLFPSPQHPNYGLYALNPGAEKPFSVLMTSEIPDLALYGSNAGQFFPRWSYAPLQDEGALLPSWSEGEVVDGYRRIDNITDEALARFRAAYGPEFSKDDVFAYVYGLLHARDYRTTYAVDLKKSLPRIPLVTDATPYVKAGRALSELHLGYEDIDPYPLDGLDGDPTDTSTAAFERYRVTKMQFGKPTPEQKSAGLRHDRSTIVYNARITLRGIPDAAYEYLLGSRSAIEWIMDRYQTKTDKASGIVNDPNDWSREVNDPRYILDLLARVVTVSLCTQEIIDSLPDLTVRTDT